MKIQAPGISSKMNTILEPLLRGNPRELATFQDDFVVDRWSYYDTVNVGAATTEIKLFGQAARDGICNLPQGTLPNETVFVCDAISVEHVPGVRINDAGTALQDSDGVYGTGYVNAGTDNAAIANAIDNNFLFIQALQQFYNTGRLDLKVNKRQLAYDEQPGLTQYAPGRGLILGGAAAMAINPSSTIQAGTALNVNNGDPRPDAAGWIVPRVIFGNSQIKGSLRLPFALSRLPAAFAVRVSLHGLLATTYAN